MAIVDDWYGIAAGPSWPEIGAMDVVDQPSPSSSMPLSLPLVRVVPMFSSSRRGGETAIVDDRDDRLRVPWPTASEHRVNVGTTSRT